MGYLELVGTSASPIRGILSKPDEDGRAAAFRAMEERFAAFETTRGWEGSNELLLTAGRRRAGD